MAPIDWIILIGTLAFIVSYGIYKTRGRQNAEDFHRGGREARWWTVGLSVMATQASAITFLSTPGEAFHSGMGFVQFYFGLPLAMIIICMVFIPLYHRLNVYTAYEFLESRFDQKTRTLTAVLFLIQRGLQAGITIYAPSIILSAVLGWNLSTLNIIIGSLVILYTISGGTKAVNVTQKQQMAVMFCGMFAAFFLIISYLPEDVTFSNALSLAGANEKMNILNFSFDLDTRYTVWSGIFGGLFLQLSYFGTDQSQVQRYLSGKSVRESQMGLIMNGFLKVPMQFFILLVGIMVFVFYQFNPAPLNFNPAATQAVYESDHAASYHELEQRHLDLLEEKQSLTTQYLDLKENPAQQKQVGAELLALDHKVMEQREAAREIIRATGSEVETNDKDYMFLHFILNNLPRGLIGLLLAVILSAAMSSTASELNALGSTTTIDLYQRNKSKPVSDRQYLIASKLFVLLWGIFAIFFASVANLFDNLIQLINIIGSIFYGNVLGIFLLAFFFKWVRGSAVFVSAIITQLIVIAVYAMDIMGYLWLNFVGCVVVILIAMLLEQFGIGGKKEAAPSK